MDELIKYAYEGIYICYFPFKLGEKYNYRFYIYDINKGVIINEIVDEHYEYFDTFEQGVKVNVEKVKRYLKNG